ncbi:MAG TPA: secretin N-terminal domain-containing protein [Elusimicrobiota bacterium]|nr:secretin N-terminal domain-containing protein [Elusimicrobiota bacterium]
MTTDHFKKALAALLAAALVVPQGAVAAFAADAASAAPAAASTAAVTAPAPAASAPASFRGVVVGPDSVSIRLSGPVQYNSFLTQKPPRLILELLDTKNDVARAARSSKGQGDYLKGVRTSQFRVTPRLITRVVLDLNKMAVYKIGSDSAGMTVKLAGSGAEDAAGSDKAAAADEPPAPKPVAAPPAVAKSDAAPPQAPRSTNQRISAPARVAMANPEPEKAIMAAAPRPEAPVVKKDLSAAAAFKRAGLEGKMQTELVAAVQAEDAAVNTAVIPKDIGDEDEGKHALGGRIFRDAFSRLPTDRTDLDFDNTDVRDVIKLLAAKSRINIIYGSDVTGTLTLHLSQVPFNEAFRTVLSMMQLTTDQVGDNVLRVITPAALTAQRTASSAITKVIPLNYAKAAAVKTTIDQVRTAEGRTGNSSADPNTNSIIVTESLEGMAATENLINQLDQRPRQVLIEAKLIEVSLNNELDYGIQWNYLEQDIGKIGGKPGLNTIGGPVGITNAGTSTQGTGVGVGQAVNGLSQPIGAGGQGTGVNLSADKIFGALTLGRVTNNYLVNATITAAASEGKAKVLSDPKIATLNNQAANINVTTQIPYVTSNVASTGVQTQTVSYATTGIQLTVTPSINADGRILLVINPNISQPSVTAAANILTGAPAVDSRVAQTTVLVRDGETIVIGGLISDSLQDNVAKIPILGDIPIIGWLFKKKTKARVRNELLIFVTTRIMPD